MSSYYIGDGSISWVHLIVALVVLLVTLPIWLPYILFRVLLESVYVLVLKLKRKKNESFKR